MYQYVLKEVVIDVVSDRVFTLKLTECGLRNEYESYTFLCRRLEEIRTRWPHHHTE